MGYHPIDIDRAELKIMGVHFPDASLFNDTLQVIDSNMFEGFELTPKGMEIVRGYMSGVIDLPELLGVTKELDMLSPQQEYYTHKEIIK